MAILHDDDARFKGLEKKIGFFVIIALLGIVLTVIAVGIQQDVFSPKTRLFIVTDSGNEISEGMAVKLRGFNIGKVEKLELTDDARVKVTLSILRSHMKWVKSDSKARLLKEGVIGANIIEITLGSEKEKPLEHDAQIAFERERGLGQVVDQLYAEVVPLIEDLNDGRALAGAAERVTTTDDFWTVKMESRLATPSLRRPSRGPRITSVGIPRIRVVTGATVTFSRTWYASLPHPSSLRFLRRHHVKLSLRESRQFLRRLGKFPVPFDILRNHRLLLPGLEVGA